VKAHHSGIGMPKHRQGGHPAKKHRDKMAMARTVNRAADEARELRRRQRPRLFETIAELMRNRGTR
jgi:hypothetical protein